MKKKTIVAAGGIVSNEQQQLLLIFRRGVWDLPKGKLDKGETIEACAVREVEEETGIRNILLGDSISVTYHEYYDKWVKADVIKETHWFAMQITGNQVLVPQTEEDIEQIQWVEGREVKKYYNNMHKNIIEVLDRYLQKAGI